MHYLRLLAHALPLVGAASAACTSGGPACSADGDCAQFFPANTPAPSNPADCQAAIDMIGSRGENGHTNYCWNKGSCTLTMQMADGVDINQAKADFNKLLSTCNKGLGGYATTNGGALLYIEANPGPDGTLKYPRCQIIDF
ncbi:hypothetical protein IE81DRAFT_339006 [Ceraceosorus guamensis]|uniref:Ecp2 effector protein domain-containing protein n=1 Tax=Ceraceosorus guamensis TaxID=1522189 RepID=A0A316W7C2_9BASI|nr:hypothetical protein IE81DRAFT_339006 [Ceraceosorus guamensis]PWN45767.1 hypothetical protein IE81DRAFT_339006 [Ceraceosorus guamensis]